MSSVMREIEPTPKDVSASKSTVIWIVDNPAQGPVQAFYERADADEFAAQLTQIGARVRVVSCALI